MEVGETIFALLLLFTPAAGWWSYRFQRQAATVAHRGGAPATGPATAPAASAPPAVAPLGGQAAATVTSVQQLERPIAHHCTSVLGWEAFTVAATVVLDGTLLLSCRREERANGCEDLTLVLRIGDDDRADQALARFEAWQEFGTTLRVRPAAVAGAIEILDNHQRVIRAPLLLA